MGKKRIRSAQELKIGIIADEGTVTGFILAGIGAIDGQGKKNYLVVDTHTRPSDIEENFRDLSGRKDIAIILISQTCANQIRNVVDEFSRSGQVVPAVLEIPTKEAPYDAKKDPIMQRVQVFFGGNDVMTMDTSKWGKSEE